MPTAKNWTSHSVIAGAGAGLVSSVVTCPLDVIKTKLQAQRVAHSGVGYLGISGTLRHILFHDGVRGLYRGLGPTLLGYLPTWAIYFAVYDSTKAWLNGVVESSDSHAHPEHHVQDSWSVHIIAAMLAGATGTVCTHPLWVIKTRFMTQPLGEPRYQHTIDAFFTIYRTEGPKAFYRGMVPSLLGISHVAVQFPFYEYLKTWCARRRDTDVSSLTSPEILLCSSLSKMTASIATYPHEVIRTRLQVQRHLLSSAENSGVSVPESHSHRYYGVIKTGAKIVSEEGWRGLYKGLSINLVRTVPNSAITLLTYELIMRHLSKLPEKG
jgi:solute carrier family 25 folate transporter 32